MVFDLDSVKPKAVWFDFPGGGRVQLRTMSVDETMSAMKMTTENKPFLYQEEGRVPVVMNHEIPDLDARSRLSNDICIVSWEGFFDADEKEIPCTSEMKTVLMRLPDPTFRNFVNEQLKKLGEAAEAQKEAERKN